MTHEGIQNLHSSLYALVPRQRGRYNDCAIGSMTKAS
jgi:hypothetical protein